MNELALVLCQDTREINWECLVVDCEPFDFRDFEENWDDFH